MVIKKSQLFTLQRYLFCPQNTKKIILQKFYIFIVGVEMNLQKFYTFSVFLYFPNICEMDALQFSSFVEQNFLTSFMFQI